MPTVDLLVRSEISRSTRARQLEAMFDVPPTKQSKCRWSFDVPLEGLDWNVGLIVGPSGSGKSTVAGELFGDHVDVPLDWKSKSVVDDFARSKSMSEIAEVCRAVGFNTIPAWLRPYKVLSTGEKFRVELARRLLELEDPIVVDEFTSVVDRQVAKIGAHAVQKFARRNGRKFVGVSCHYDIIDWLQPDWTLEPGTGRFARRSVQPRPPLECEIVRVDHSCWKLFAPFHYLSADLHRAARCFVLFCEGRPATFAAILHRPHPKVRNIKGLSRGVTLPDWQGLGLMHYLQDALGAAYKALDWRLHVYPSHPTWIRSVDRSAAWELVRSPGTFAPSGRWGVTRKTRIRNRTFARPQGMRQCATFAYAGEAMDEKTARRLTGEKRYDPDRLDG